MSTEQDWRYYIHDNLTKSYLRPKKMRSLIPDFPGRWWFHYSIRDLYGDGLFRGDYSQSQCGIWLAPSVQYGTGAAGYSRFTFIPRDANGKVLHTGNTAEYIRALARGLYEETKQLEADSAVHRVVCDGIITSDKSLYKQSQHIPFVEMRRLVSTRALLAMENYNQWYVSWVARREPVMVCAEGENSPHVEIVGKNGKTKRIEGAYPL